MTKQQPLIERFLSFFVNPVYADEENMSLATLSEPVDFSTILQEMFVEEGYAQNAPSTNLEYCPGTTTVNG